MRLRELELRRIRLDLVTPFRTSFGTESTRDILLLRVGADDVGAATTRHDGWGECVAMSEPAYSPEFVDGAQLVISEHFWPNLAAVGDVTARDVGVLLGRYSGHPMAKAALEMALLDAELRAAKLSYHQYLGATRRRVPSGVSVGIFDELSTLLDEVAAYVEAGYARIKLKIEPGWDIEPVRAVRQMIGPEMGLQVDANTAYRRDDIAHLTRLDEFDLLLIEQPLPEEDLIGHARLAAATSTPICLDESVVSLATAIDAIELGAADVINIKPGRVGGYLAARSIHDYCFDHGVPVWCGGMVETGIGRAANAALASLPGFTLPGDISASARFYERDIVTEPIVVDDGTVAVPEGVGFGVTLDTDFLDEITTSSTVLAA